MNPLLALQSWYRNASPNKKRQALLITVGTLATVALMLGNGGGASASDPLDSTPLFFVGVAVKLAAVLLLIAGGAVIFKRWFGNRVRSGSDRQMHLVETIRLSPKQALHVVEVGGQHFLIGATDQNISMLSNVELSPSVSETAGQSQPALSFDKLFASLDQKTTPPQPGE